MQVDKISAGGVSSSSPDRAVFVRRRLPESDVMFFQQSIVAGALIFVRCVARIYADTVDPIPYRTQP